MPLTSLDLRGWLLSGDESLQPILSVRDGTNANQYEFEELAGTKFCHRDRYIWQINSPFHTERRVTNRNLFKPVTGTEVVD